MAEITPARERSTHQLDVLHISDIHFGPKHRFRPERTVSGDIPVDAGHPSLAQKFLEDLNEPSSSKLIVCATGDFAEAGDFHEFKNAEEFLKQLMSGTIRGRRISAPDVFVCPGNHDVKFDAKDDREKWQQWHDFYCRFYGRPFEFSSPLDYVLLHDRFDDLGAIILTINSSQFVQKDSPDAIRGRVDMTQLTKIEKLLSAVDEEKLERSIKIALVHHHPVLIPTLAESGRGYDAIVNSGLLLASLRRYGFHLVLHGHKHNPHTFTDDTMSAYQDTKQHPIFISCGGTIGSTELPDMERRSNCYNLITIKWHWRAQQTRVRTETRGLITSNKDGSPRLATLWEWKTLRVEDRRFLGGESAPHPCHGPLCQRAFVDASEDDASEDTDPEKKRRTEYEHTRGNLPVMEVLPSFLPDHAYEARLWIVEHQPERRTKSSDAPTAVTWRAGQKFPVIRIARTDDPHFCASFNYWGPMLVQAELEFEDGYIAYSYIYAHIPSRHDLRRQGG